MSISSLALSMSAVAAVVPNPLTDVAASLHAHSLAASRVEQALSEVASSISSLAPRPGPQRAWLLQLQVWLLIAEIYLVLDQVSAAAASIAEATSIFPLSHHIMYTVSLGAYSASLEVIFL